MMEVKLRGEVISVFLPQTVLGIFHYYLMSGFVCSALPKPSVH